MTRIYRHVIRLLMLLSFGMLPGGFVECDLEDGELELDFDDLDDLYIDVWYH